MKPSTETSCVAITRGDVQGGKQGLRYFEGVSAETAGSQKLCLHVVVIPPLGRAKPHLHESAIYVLSGEAGYEYGLTPPVGHRKTSLDRYRVTASDKIFFGEYYIYQVYKPLKDNWYLYLFVN